MTLLVAALVVILVDDLVRGGDCKSAIYDKSAKVFDAGGSTLSQAWTQAEVDQVYSYDDTRCTDDCKVVEFVYLASAAYLGSDADLGTDELRLANRDELAASLPSVIELFESSDYVYPTVV